MLRSDFQKLFVDGLVTLFELDASALGAGILRFHGLAQAGNIIWQGDVFEPMTLEVDGLEMRTDGRASNPTIRMGNKIGEIQGAVSIYCLKFQDLVGSKLKVIKTLSKYLDAENFADGNPTASNESEFQLWYIEQKTSENAMEITFELRNPCEFKNQRIPALQITSMCPWAIAGYRGERCGYIGTAMFDEKNQPTDDPAQDRCPGYLKSCRLRKNESRFGGQPASNMVG
ncbi:phage minor tail protein L [Acinetobacter stercoris]|uniref:Phage minor tail protein L n=1 Tax=Acinetobacter stercoris TaxID=2126983 RepID=A0A2U3MUM8_9GAMM|nr:phage minor tail protein L [Acinetobacter stercoris]SPL69138.1 Phage minor tail protein L [Acinetobacter stercoris]